MRTYKEYIEEKKEKWIGKEVSYKGKKYKVVDVDYNGGLLINKPKKYHESYTSPTTVIAEFMLDEQ